METNYRKAAGDKASSAGLQNTIIKQHGKKQDCLDYLNNGTWPAAWGDPKPVIRKGSITTPVAVEPVTATTEAVKEPLPVVTVEPEPVKEPLPVDSISGEAVKDSLPVALVLPEAVKEPLPVPAMVKPPKAPLNVTASHIMGAISNVTHRTLSVR